MTGVSFVHTATKFCHELMVFQAPARNGKEAGGGLGNEAFEDEVGTEAFDEVNNEVNVFVGGKEMEVGGMFCIFLRHSGVLDELELVEFEGGERESGKDFGFVKDGFPTLSRKAEDEVSTNGDAPSGCAGNGINGLGVVVATVDTRQRRVIGGLDAVFDEKESMAI